MIEIIVSVKIACGYEHTLALTNKGDIYAWGSNHRRQVGVNFKIRSCGPIMVTHGLLKNFNNCHYKWYENNKDRRSIGERA